MVKIFRTTINNISISTSSRNDYAFNQENMDQSEQD